ncbi:MAG: glycerate kinase [Wujia sp.]
MKVTVAIDSYKGSMSSMEAGTAAKAGILRVIKDADVCVFPVADGGEGTVDALAYGKENRRQHEIRVTGPLGAPVDASYITYDSECGMTAVIEMASAAGLALVPPEKRNPMYTTTYGVGEMIRDAVNRGCRQFIVGIGGSATNDGGIGMLQALGYRFVDACGEDVPFGAAGLEKLSDIYFEDVMPELSGCTFRVMCDVKNPLLGERGCSAVFAPQKGADASMIERMERSMRHYADLVEHIAGCDEGPLRVGNHQGKYSIRDRRNSFCMGTDRNSEGAGAAGGLGYAFLMFLYGKLERGVDVILQELNLEQAIVDSDYVITGEGRLDAQTIMGKAPAGVAALAKKHGKKVLAFAGCIGEGAKICCTSGLMDAYYAITDIDFSDENGQERQARLADAMQKEHAIRNLEDKVEEVFEQGMVSRNYRRN